MDESNIARHSWATSFLQGYIWEYMHDQIITKEVTVIAERVLGTRALAEQWLSTPALALNGQRPVDLLTNGGDGIAAVKDLLTRIDYCVFT